ncbi:hypothetical protein ACWDDN_42575 [Streptomyces griseoruber]
MKVIRTLAVVLAAWIFWAVLFFAPIPFLPRTNFWGLVTAAVCFFVMPSAALKATQEWRDHGRVKAPKSKIPAGLLGFERHVPFSDDGVGVTFQIVKGQRGPQFVWFFDTGMTPDNLMVTYWVNEELAKIETELGLPVTFRHATPEGRAELDRRDRERQAEIAAKVAAAYPTLAELQTAAEEGRDFAVLRAWGRSGTPVTDPEQLVVGRYYYLGYDIGRYSGSFEGRRWKGTEFENDEDDNEEGTWFTFTVAQSTVGGDARYSAAEVTEISDGVATVYAPAVSQQEAARVFDAWRAAHVESEARRRTK